MSTTIAVLGGTGPEGGGLALRWAHAGHTVIIGSRDAARAQAAAEAINAKIGAERASGAANAEAAAAAEIVVLTVPYAAHEATLESVKAACQGKILVDVTVPLVPGKVTRVALPPGGSASQEAQALLGPEVRVVTAFQNVSAEHLGELGHPVNCDVLVCGDDKASKATVIALAKDGGMTAYDAGPLANAVIPEGLTSVLIGLNIRHKVKHSGIKITGIAD